MKRLMIISGILAIAASACASGGPIPADKLSRAQAAVRGAQEMGAERNTNAAVHLQNARQELASGRKLVLDGEQDRAVPMLLRAEADAELAMNTTRESAAMAETQKTQTELRALRMSMSKGGN